MKRFLGRFFLVVFLPAYLVMLAFIPGCAATEKTADFLFAPQKSQVALELETSLQPDRQTWQTVLDNPKASNIDKQIAKAAIKSIDTAVEVEKQKNPGDSLATTLLTIAAAFGIPGTLAGAAGTRMFGRWYQQQKKANEQTVQGIEQAKKDNPQVENALENALSKTQDQDVKELIAKIKAEGNS